jgi:hypothetical protein
MMIWIFIIKEGAVWLSLILLTAFDFMEMKHAHPVWQVAMTLFMVLLFGTISFSI